MEKLYTIKQVAEIFSVHPNTVRRWVRESKINTTKLEVGTERISETEVKRFAGLESVGESNDN